MKRLLRSCWIRHRGHRWHPPLFAGANTFYYCQDCPAWKWSPM